jgi:hypothetical protein
MPIYHTCKRIMLADAFKSKGLFPILDHGQRECLTILAMTIAAATALVSPWLYVSRTIQWRSDNNETILHGGWHEARLPQNCTGSSKRSYSIQAWADSHMEVHHWIYCPSNQYIQYPLLV